VTDGTRQLPDVVPAEAMPAGEIRARWAWVEAEVWTARLLTAIDRGGSLWATPRPRAVNPLGGKTTNWRAGCGRPACPVRREGERLALSLPLS